MSETDKALESMRNMLRDMKLGGYFVSARTTEDGIATIERLQLECDELKQKMKAARAVIRMYRGKKKVNT